MSTSGLNWLWIALGSTLPPCAGVLVAYPIWRTGQTNLGNVAGSLVIFAAAIGLIMREHVELEVMALFSLGLRVEANRRRRSFAPEWR